MRLYGPIHLYQGSEAG
jgi:hypothetical protein